MMMMAYHSQQDLGFEAVDITHVSAIKQLPWELCNYANDSSKQGLISHENAFQSTHLPQQDGVSMLQDNPQNKGQYQGDWNDMNLFGDDSTGAREGESIIAIVEQDCGTNVTRDTSSYVPQQQRSSHESSEEDLGIEFGKGGIQYKQDQEEFDSNGSSEHEFTQEADIPFSTYVSELQTSSTYESSEEDLGIEFGKGGILYKQDQFDSSLSSKYVFTQEAATPCRIEYNKGGVTYGLRHKRIKWQIPYLVLIVTLLATQVVMIATVSRLWTSCLSEHKLVPRSKPVLLSQQNQILTDMSSTHPVQTILQLVESHNHRPVKNYEIALYSDAFTSANSNSILPTSDMQLNELSQGQLLLEQFLQYEQHERLRKEYWLSFSRQLEWIFRPQFCTLEEDQKAEICDYEPTTVCQAQEQNIFMYNITQLKDQPLPSSATMDATTLYSTYRLTLNVAVLRSCFVAIANKVLNCLTIEEFASLLVVLSMLSGILVPNIRASSLQASLKRFLYHWIILFLTAALLVTYHTVHVNAEPALTANRSEPTRSPAKAILRHSGGAYPSLVEFDSTTQENYSYALELASFPRIIAAAIGNEHTWLLALLTLHEFGPLLAICLSFFLYTAINYHNVYRNALLQVSYCLADSYSLAQVTIHCAFQLLCDKIKRLMNIVNSSCLHTDGSISSFKPDLEAESFEKSDVITHYDEQEFGDHHRDLKQETNDATSRKHTNPIYVVTKPRCFIYVYDSVRNSYMEVKPDSLIPDFECRHCESNKITVQCYPIPQDHLQASSTIDDSKTKQSKQQVSWDTCNIDYHETLVTSRCGNDISQESAIEDSSEEPLLSEEKNLVILKFAPTTKVTSQSSDVITNYFVGSSQASFSFEIDGVDQDGTKTEFKLLTSVMVTNNNSAALLVIHPACGHGASHYTTIPDYPNIFPQLNWTVWEASGNILFFVFVESFSTVSVEIFRGIVSHLMTISNRDQLLNLLRVSSPVSDHDHSVSTDGRTFTREGCGTDHPKPSCSTTGQIRNIVSFVNIGPPKNESFLLCMTQVVSYEPHSQNIPKDHVQSYGLPSVLLHVQQIIFNITSKLGTSPSSGCGQELCVPSHILPDTEQHPPVQNLCCINCPDFNRVASRSSSCVPVENIVETPLHRLTLTCSQNVQDGHISMVCVRKEVLSSNADYGKLKTLSSSKQANLLLNGVPNGTTPVIPAESSTSHTQNIMRCGGKQESSVPGENVSELVTCTSRNKQQISLDSNSHNSLQHLEGPLINIPLQNVGSEVAVILSGSVLNTNTNMEHEFAPIQLQNQNHLPEITVSTTLMSSINSTLSSSNCHSSAVGLAEKDDVGLIQPTNTSLVCPCLSWDQGEGMLLANPPLSVLSPPNLANEPADNDADLSNEEDADQGSLTAVPFTEPMICQQAQELWSPETSLAVYSTLMMASYEPVQSQCPLDDEVGYSLVSTKSASYLKPSIQMVEEDMSLKDLTTMN